MTRPSRLPFLAVRRRPPHRGRRRRAGPARAAHPRAGGRRVEHPAARAHPHRGAGARGDRPHPRRRRDRPAEGHRGVARRQPQGRARLRARRADPTALRRRRREPVLDPRLGPAQQLPPARHQRADRRLPLRQRRRLQRLRVARAPDHQVHRGLQGRQRAPLRRQHPGRRHQPRHQDRLRRRPHREPRRGRLLRLLQGLRRHRPGVRPARPLRELQRHGAAGLPGATASRRATGPSAPPATSSPAGATLRFDLGYVHNKEQLPGALTPEQFRQNPQQQNPATKLRQGGAQLRLHPRRAHASARRSARTRPSSGRPSSTTRTWTTRSPSRSSTRRPTATAPSCATCGRRRSSAAATASPRASSSSAPARPTPSSRTSTATAAPWSRTRYNDAQHLRDVRREPARRRAHRGARDRRAAAGHRRSRCATSYLVNGNQSDSTGFFGASPKVGFVWRAAPTVQVFGNASRAYEPPLLLELTAPGQIGGDLSQLDAQTSWQFEVGTRGQWGERLSWDSRSTTSSCGTRSRTSTSSPSPAPRSPSPASRTSTARATPASRWAPICCS